MREKMDRIFERNESWPASVEMSLENLSQGEISALDPMPGRIEVTGLFEDILKSGSDLRVRVTGRSMSPFLQGGEVLTIRKVPLASLRRGDLIFFKDSRGYPVLHRLIRKKHSNSKFIFQTKGDALVGFDEPVLHEDVLGKAFKIEKNSAGCAKEINLESLLWKKINHLAAMSSLIKSKARFAVLKLLGR